MDKTNLLHAVQKLSFALIETGLYLNSHPDCEEALSFFRETQKAYDSVLAEYEKTIGSMTAGSSNCDTWDWVCTPWPWELGVN